MLLIYFMSPSIAALGFWPSVTGFSEEFPRHMNVFMKKIFWPCDHKEVTSFVKDSHICSLSRPRFLQTPNSPIISKAPMEVMALDFVGPLPSSKRYKYLSAIDTYSRYAFIEPVVDLSAASLICACKNVFSLCGFPNNVLSDRGAQLCISEFRTFLRNFNVKWMTTCSYSPKSNGCCERFNGTVQKSIFAYLKKAGLDQFQWLLSLPAVLLNYSTSVHASTGCRPVDLFFNFRVAGLSPQSPQGISKESMYGKVNSRLHKKIEKTPYKPGQNSGTGWFGSSSQTRYFQR